MKALIIANGSIPKIKKVRNILKKSDLVICADGGANTASKISIKPDVIIGDFDSVTENTLKYFKNVEKIKIEDQDSTDLEKAIIYCINHGYKNIDIIGATGRRTDHTIGNLGCFRKFRGKVNLKMIDSNGEIILIDKKVKIKSSIGEIISLIPLERCTGINTKNLKYPLVNGILELGVQEGTHNIAVGRSVTIEVKNGTLLLYRVENN